MYLSVKYTRVFELYLEYTLYAHIVYIETLYKSMQ